MRLTDKGWLKRKKEDQPAKRPVGRPEKQDIKLPASAEEIARNIFEGRVSGHSLRVGVTCPQEWYHILC